MKLLYCPSCHDVQGLIMPEWRTCLCGLSGGQYNKDGMTATIGGMGKVFGIGNPFFELLYSYLEEKGLKKMQKDFYGHEKGDCWWGEYEGDKQIFRIAESFGPRLKIRIQRCMLPGYVQVKVIDKRSFSVVGKIPQNEHAKEFDVPANPQVKLKIKTRWDNAKSGIQKASKHRRRRLRRNTSKRTTSVRSNQGGTTDNQNGKASQELDRAGSPGSNSHSKDEQTRTFPGRTVTNKDIA